MEKGEKGKAGEKVFLTKKQEKMLNGEYGDVIKKCMEILTKIGDIYNADKLIPIESAQIAGVSYLTVGDSIFSFFKLLTKEPVKVKVPTWLNPAGMDLDQWKSMKIDKKFADKQLKIISLYKTLGVNPTLTCTPYFIGNKPRKGSHLAWSESSAIVMANSFFGAKTNREGGPSSLAAAITGLTANYGLHIDSNREPTIYVKVNTSLNSYVDFALLGYWYGEKFRSQIPLFSTIKNFSITNAKYLSSAIAASGSAALYHVDAVTPESKHLTQHDIHDRVDFDTSEKKETMEKMQDEIDDIELIVIGCPHIGLEEVDLILSYCEKRYLNPKVEFWLFIARDLLNENKVREKVNRLQEKNIRFFSDTCMVVSPAVRNNFNKVVTNSAKAYFYLAKIPNMKVKLLSLKEIMEYVCRK